MKKASSFLADGFLRASDYLLVCHTGELRIPQELCFACLPQSLIDVQLQDSDVFSGAQDKCVIREADDARSSRLVHAQGMVIHDVPQEWSHQRPLKGSPCYLFFERPIVACVYHPPVTQIVVYHSQQVVWNLLSRHRLDSVLPSLGIKRMYVLNTYCACHC